MISSNFNYKRGQQLVLILVFSIAITLFNQKIYAAPTTTALDTFERAWGWGVAGGSGFEICFSNCTAGNPGTGNGQFDEPLGIVATSDNNLFVLGEQYVQEFTPDGQFVAKWGGYTTTAEGNILAGGGIGVDDDDNIYVTDRSLFRVQKFDRDGNFLLMWGGGVATGADEFEICTSGCLAGSFGGGQGRFKQAEGIDVDASGNVYVVDSLKNRVQQYDTSGNFIAVWGGSGSSEGQFVDPTQLAVSDAGQLYVADTGNHRIQQFDNNGNFQRTWGRGVDDGSGTFQICTSGCQAGIPVSFGTQGDGDMSEPRGLTLDDAGNLFVADSNYYRIQQFNANGTFLFKWGDFGGGEGAFNEPADVVSDSIGNITVVDQRNDRIQKFGSTDLTQSCTAGIGDAAAVATAVATANLNSDANTISLPPNCVYEFNSAQISPLGPSVLKVTTPLTIDGNGSTIRRNSTDLFRLFYISSSGDLTLNDLILDNGYAQGGDGGDVDGPGAGGGGGGLGGDGANGAAGLPANGGGGGGEQGDANGRTGGPTTGAWGGNSNNSKGGNGGLGGGGGGGGRPTTTTNKDNGGNGGFGGGGGGGPLTCPIEAEGDGGNGGFGGGGGGGGRGSGDGGAAGAFAGAGFGGPECDNNNTEGGGGGGGAGLGGALIIDGGTVTINRSTLKNNVAEGGIGPARGGEGAGLGGAIFMRSGTLMVTNSTLTGNNALAPGNGKGHGAALFIRDGTATLNYNTISDNTNQHGGTIYLWDHNSVAGVLHMTGNIVANTINIETNDGAECEATLTTNDFNLTEDGSCAATITGDPALGTVGLNGGQTPNYPITLSSLAYDAAANDCSGKTGNVDQRSSIRPLGSACDIGSYELWGLGITAVTPTDAELFWQVANSNCTYDIFESTTPYFTPTDPSDYTTLSLTQALAGKLGTVGTNYFYINRATCDSVTTPYSNEVGEFDFAIVPGN